MMLVCCVQWLDGSCCNLVLDVIRMGFNNRQLQSAVHAKFYSDRIRGFASAHARLRAPLLTRLFLGGRVLEITYTQDATTDIDAKYVKRHGSVQGCAVLGSQNHTLTSTPPFTPKTSILEPDYDGT